MKASRALLAMLLIGSTALRPAPVASASSPSTKAAGGPRWVTPAVKAPGVQFRTFESRAAGATVSHHVCLPPSAVWESRRRLPVVYLVYWLHGTGGGVARWR